MNTHRHSLKHTPLHDFHVELGARMAPFAGFDMPIQYSGILDEHNATRKAVAVFDTCHMGEFNVRGSKAVQDVEKLLTADIDSLQIGRCRYSFMCNHDGGVIDDLLVYRLARSEFMLVVNASRKAADLQWLDAHCSPGTTITDRSEQTAKIDLQGPGAPVLMQTLTGQSISGMTFYSFMHNTYCKEQVLISRTGYTGEVGFEVYCSPDAARQFWTDCLDADVTPAGLGARDTLRLEMGMPLYGHELDETRNPAQTGASRSISTMKAFIGAAQVTRDDPARQRLVGIRFPGRRAAREGAPVLDADEQHIGMVTSGSFAPSLGHAVALAYINPWFATPGTPVQVAAGKSLMHGTVAALPFYTDGSARKKLSRFLRTSRKTVKKRREPKHGNTTRSQVYEVA